MKFTLGLVRTVHAWAGAALSLILMVLGLSGALLVFKADWIRWRIPQAREAVAPTPDVLGAAAEAIEAAHAGHLHHVVFADETLGVHRLFLHEGAYGYADASGQTLVRWSGTGRPEEWLYQLHHFLLAGETGMKLAGFAALCACALVLTGLVVWAPVWRAWRPRLWPRSARRGELIGAHRNIGVVFALPVLLFCLTGGAMIFYQTTHDLLQRLAPGPGPEEFFPPVDPGDIDWPAALAAAQARFPDARLRVAVWPRFAVAPAEIRLRQPGEWTPDGRTKVLIDPSTSQVIGVIDAMALGDGYRLENALLPLHGAFVGGRVFDLVTFLTGLALAALGGLGLWSFIVKPRRRTPHHGDKPPRA